MGWFRRKKRAAVHIPAAQATKCIGRDTEIKSLLERFEKDSSATLIYGDPLIGKTTLLEQVRDKELKEDGSLVGFWRPTGEEDVLVYALNDLLERLYNTASLKEQWSIFLANMRKETSTPVRREAFLEKISSFILPEKIRNAIHEMSGVIELKVPQEMRPDLGREVFKDIVKTLMECFPEKRLVFIIDNLSKGFEGVQIPDYAQKALLTFSEVVQKNIRVDRIHILASWKLNNYTRAAFDSISKDFKPYWSPDSVVLLQPLELEKYRGEIESFLDESCSSFRNKADEEKNEIISASLGLPKVIFDAWRSTKDLSTNDFLRLANEFVHNNYTHIATCVDNYNDNLQRILYHLSVLPKAEDLPLHHIAELVLPLENYPPCRCAAKGRTDKDFEAHVKQLFEVLQEPVRDKILKYENRGTTQHVYSLHDVYKAAIKESARKNEYEGISLYIKRAFDYYLYHTGFPTTNYPLAALNIFNVLEVVQELPTTDKEQISNTIYPLSASFTTVLNQHKYVQDTIASSGFKQLPIHLKIFVLSEALKFKELEGQIELISFLRTLTPEVLTYFQAVSIAKALTNATADYGRLDKPAEMQGCLDTSKTLYKKHKTPEVAMIYASALTNATNRYGKMGKSDEMQGCLNASNTLYDKHETPELALVYAKALTSATADYCRLDKPAEMQRCLDATKALYDEHKTPELALQYAMALTSAVVAYNNKNKSADAKRCLDVLTTFLHDKLEVGKQLHALIKQTSR